MNSTLAHLPPGDPKLIEDIVERLKREGLFDQFRKESLADVDTKPAYQNLRQRVESFVERFLSTQKWSPHLNKNHLRDTLRRQINSSNLLATGVDRIIDQVVNPKVHTVFKAQLDKAVCQYLGIDPDEWEAYQKRKEAAAKAAWKSPPVNKGPDFTSPVRPGFSSPPQIPVSSMGQSVSMPQPNMSTAPPLMQLPTIPAANFSMPPPNTNIALQTMQTNSQLTNMPGMGQGMMPGTPTALPGMPPLPYQTAGHYPPTPPNPYSPYTMTPQPYQQLSTQTFPGMPPQNFSPAQSFTPQSLGITPLSLPSTSSDVTSSVALAHQQLTMEGTGFMSQMDRNLANAIGLMNQQQQPASGSQESKETKTPEKPKKKEKLPELTVESLLDIPLPKVATNSATTSKSKPGTKQKASVDNKSATADSNKANGNIVKEEVVVSKLGSPHQAKSSASEDTETAAGDAEVRLKEEPETQDVEEKLKHTVAESSEVITEVVPQATEPEDAGKVYQFSWEHARSDAMSEVTVSSVHTSDLSSFEDENSMSESESEASVQNEDVSQDEVVQKETSDQYFETGTESVVVSEMSASDMEPSPVKNPKPDFLEEEAVAKKPRKLVALQYNYSDSDDDETREERKARIAKEKEDRYLRRQQRRAELEAKREERARQMKEKQLSNQQDSIKSEKDVAKDEAGSDEKEMPESAEVVEETSDDKKDEREEKEPEKSPTKKRQRKTKDVLKKEIMEKKVLEKKMALRRQRTRNKRYTSGEFTSIFTDKKHSLLSNESYTEVVEESMVEESVEITTTESEANVSTEQVDLTQGLQFYDKSPATPTQDEHFEYSAPDNEVVLTTDQSNIPIYEVTAAPSASLTVGQVAHMTRSQTKKLSLDEKSRPDTPYSDISDGSISKLDTEPPVPKKARRKSEETASGPVTPESNIHETRSSRRLRRTSSSATSEGDSRDSSREERKQSSQRYDTSDLYKPRMNLRRASSPSALSLSMPRPYDLATSQRNEAADRLSEQAHSQRYDSSDLYKPRQSYHSRRRSPSPEKEQFQSVVSSERPARTPSPTVSKSDSDRTRSPSPGRRNRYPQPPSPSGSHSPSPGISRRGRAASPAEDLRQRKPISMVNFGEAARRAAVGATNKRPIQAVDFGLAAKRGRDNVNFGEAERRSRLQKQSNRLGRQQSPREGFRHRGMINERFIECPPEQDERFGGYERVVPYPRQGMDRSPLKRPLSPPMPKDKRSRSTSPKNFTSRSPFKTSVSPRRPVSPPMQQPRSPGELSLSPPSSSRNRSLSPPGLHKRSVSPQSRRPRSPVTPPQCSPGSYTDRHYPYSGNSDDLRARSHSPPSFPNSRRGNRTASPSIGRRLSGLHRPPSPGGSFTHSVSPTRSVSPPMTRRHRLSGASSEEHVPTRASSRSSGEMSPSPSPPAVSRRPRGNSPVTRRRRDTDSDQSHDAWESRPFSSKPPTASIGRGGSMPNRRQQPPSPPHTRDPRRGRELGPPPPPSIIGTRAARRRAEEEAAGPAKRLRRQ